MYTRKFIPFPSNGDPNFPWFTELLKKEAPWWQKNKNIETISTVHNSKMIHLAQFTYKHAYIYQSHILFQFIMWRRVWEWYNAMQ